MDGVGIHKNEPSKLSFFPAESKTGIIFKKMGGNAPCEIPACYKSVSDTHLAVSIANGEFEIRTIEHLMFAIYVLGITDLIIEVEGGAEIPILDGSAAPFVDALERSKVVEHKDKLEPIIISEEIFVGDAERYIKISEYGSLAVRCTIDFPHPMLRESSVFIECKDDLLKERIAPARTFGFLKEAGELRENGYALGGSTHNTVVFTEESSLNPLRAPHEPVHHKILDILGDLSLLGRPLQGLIKARCSGHSLDIQLAQKIAEKYL